MRLHAVLSWENEKLGLQEKSSPLERDRHLWHGPLLPSAGHVPKPQPGLPTSFPVLHAQLTPAPPQETLESKQAWSGSPTLIKPTNINHEQGGGKTDRGTAGAGAQNSPPEPS